MYVTLFRLAVFGIGVSWTTYRFSIGAPIEINGVKIITIDEMIELLTI
jgi:hypothetical protein